MAKALEEDVRKAIALMEVRGYPKAQIESARERAHILGRFVEEEERESVGTGTK